MTSYPLGVICIAAIQVGTYWCCTLVPHVDILRWYLTLVSYVDILHQRHQSMSPNSPLQS
ncbi:MAG: hypothetical protein UF218_05570 [Eggerthellaceae bacterium]|nr:hypothetical protein [Eggerthellaceae bacterium]